MTWPASDVAVTNMDAGSDSAASARVNILDLAQKFNQLRTHVSAFMQGVLAAVDAAAARAQLALTNHQLLSVDGSGNASVPGNLISSSGTISSAVSLQTSGYVYAGNYVSAVNQISAGSYVYASGYLQTPGAVYAGAAQISGGINAGGTITASGNVVAYSDERLKSAWRPLRANFLQQLAGVRLGTYRMKGKGRKRFVGVSAQELQRVLPEAIEQDEQGLLSVAYGNAALVACIELAREVRALRCEVAQLKGAA